jgi:hypothetical protein
MIAFITAPLHTKKRVHSPIDWRESVSPFVSLARLTHFSKEKIRMESLHVNDFFFLGETFQLKAFNIVRPILFMRYID